MSKCPYFDSDYGKICIAQKDTPQVTCEGVLEKCRYRHVRKVENNCQEDELPKKEMVNHPDHYNKSGIEAIEAMKAATAGLTGIEAVCTATAIKYLWRWKWKNGVEDLRKAIWYIDYLAAYETALDKNE